MTPHMSGIKLKDSWSCLGQSRTRDQWLFVPGADHHRCRCSQACYMSFRSVAGNQRPPNDVVPMIWAASRATRILPGILRCHPHDGVVTIRCHVEPTLMRVGPDERGIKPKERGQRSVFITAGHLSLGYTWPITAAPPSPAHPGYFSPDPSRHEYTEPPRQSDRSILGNGPLLANGWLETTLPRLSMASPSNSRPAAYALAPLSRLRERRSIAHFVSASCAELFMDSCPIRLHD